MDQRVRFITREISALPLGAHPGTLRYFVSIGFDSPNITRKTLLLLA
jgi:hypothetical protein